MVHRAYNWTLATRAVVPLAALHALRFVGLYSHQALALVLIAGLFWAILGRGGFAWKGRLRTELPRAIQRKWHRRELLNAIARATFWGIAAAACLWVFPRSAELMPLMAVLAGIGVVRIAVSFVTPRRSNSVATLAMVIAGAVMLVDLGRTFVRGSAAVQIAAPFGGEWLVLQGGRSPLQNHHLTAYNQHFAIDLVRLENGYVFDSSGEAQGNAATYGWEQPLVSPVDGRVVFTRDYMEDADGAGTAATAADAAGNVIVIELDNGLFVLLAHLRHGSLRIEAGDVVRTGEPLARVGNSGNTTMPHLHLQVQTHADLWDPDNRSVPFAFDTDGRVPVRNDRIGGAARTGVNRPELRGTKDNAELPAPSGQGDGPASGQFPMLIRPGRPAQNVIPDAGGDPLHRSLHRVLRQVRVLRGRLHPRVAQQLADHRQALPERQRPRGERMPQIVQPHVLQIHPLSQPVSEREQWPPRCPERPQILSDTPGYAPAIQNPENKPAKVLEKADNILSLQRNKSVLSRIYCRIFKGVARLCNRQGVSRTEIIRQFPPLPGRWIFSGNMPFECALEASGTSWEMLFPATSLSRRESLGKTRPGGRDMPTGPPARRRRFPSREFFVPSLLSVNWTAGRIETTKANQLRIFVFSQVHYGPAIGEIARVVAVMSDQNRTRVRNTNGRLEHEIQ